MLGLGELKQTKVYQEAKDEGKLETVPFMLNLGATVEQIATTLGSIQFWQKYLNSEGKHI
jgi:predicted transposase YdaD